MNKAIILHGKPKRERYFDESQPKPHEANWLPWLGEKLAEQGIEVNIPAFPEPYAPDYQNFDKSATSGTRVHIFARKTRTKICPPCLFRARFISRRRDWNDE